MHGIAAALVYLSKAVGLNIFSALHAYLLTWCSDDAEYQFNAFCHKGVNILITVHIT